MKQEFTIQGRMDGANEYTNANRINRYRGAEMKKRNQDMAAEAIRKARLIPQGGSVYITITWVEPNMRRDPDNVRFAAKFILDALVSEGVLADDSQKHVTGISDYFRVNASNPRIEVVIEGV